MYHPALRCTLALSALVATACSTGLDANLDGEVNLQMAALNSAAPSAATPQRIELGSDVIVLQKVELVMREIELEGSDDICADSAAAPADSTSDDCNELEFGPMIVELPLDGDVAHAISAQVVAGTYEEIEFKIHRPDDDSADDRAFLQAHPDFADVSIRVTGTWNGEPFVYEGQQGYEQEIELSPPLVLADGSADLTLSVDVGRWFVNATGTGLVDPRLALEGLAFESLVEHNIELSFEAFRDDDRDGHSDDD
ncbi:MAG: hypothetical protein ACM357_02060 [Gemmatimonadota bacterium]